MLILGFGFVDFLFFHDVFKPFLGTHLIVMSPSRVASLRASISPSSRLRSRSRRPGDQDRA